jgi:pimeloyl-ACP methyl ester carboxylesterase
MPFAQSGNTRIWYDTRGTGPALLLVPGQGSDHTGWLPLVPLYSRESQVILFDHRGTGQSDAPDDGYSTREFARDAVAVLDAAGVDRAHCYGVSMGGRVCQWLGIEHGDRVLSLVLGCTTPGDRCGVKRPPEVDAWMSSRPESPEARAEVMLDAMFTPAFVARNPQVRELYLERARNPLPPRIQKLHYQASQGHDACDRLGEIASPTLVIHGSDDMVNPTANAAILAERIAGAELVIVEGARHGYFLEFREESDGAVRDFLRRHNG